jgi:hypothetical protein
MMRIGKIVFNLVVCGLFVVACNSFGSTKNKFEKEVDNEQAAVKLVREVQRGNYNVITAKELKDLMGSEKNLLIIDTMPYDGTFRSG